MTALTVRTRRWLIAILALIIAGVLAFPLRGMIHETIVVPTAFIVWSLGLLYRSLPQGIWWTVIILIVFFMVLFSLIPQPRFRPRTQPTPKPQLGPVESLTASLRRADHGIYSKWLVANRLGKLAYQILLQRENGRPRSVFAPLVGVDWEPAKDLQKYLETGLHGSFADFPGGRGLFGVPRKTPLDYDIAEAVQFLEAQVENGESKDRQ